MPKINPMNTRSNKELLYGHSILHGWANTGKTNWNKSQIIKEHSRLVNIMKKRKINHNSPLTYQDFNKKVWG